MTFGRDRKDWTAAMTVGVLPAQIGTPDEPTAEALRPYLKTFLSDRRVIDYPPFLWQPLLRGIILRGPDCGRATTLISAATSDLSL